MTRPDHGTMGAWWQDKETDRANAHAAACKRAFESDGEPPRFIDVRDGGNLPRDHEWPITPAMVVCAVIGVAVIFKVVLPGGAWVIQNAAWIWGN